MKTFYKLTQPNGWDFYTGKTINYRENIGKIVKCPKFNKEGHLCSSAFIHASRDPTQCFLGAKIPCSAFLVTGNPIKKDKDKCGFSELLIVRELKPKEIFNWDYETAINPVNPFKIKPPKIAKREINLVKDWDSVRASVWDSMRASVWASVWDSVRASVGASMGDSVRASVWDSVGASMGASVWDSVWASMGDSVRASVWDSMRASVWASMRDSMGAYFGSIFSPCISKWKYIEHKKGVYPFQPAVDLWYLGLIPSFDGKIWRLHGGEKGKILWKE